MKKLEIGPYADGRTPDGKPKATWDSMDSTYSATFRCAWGQHKLPIENETYDWIHASHVLEHIPWWQTKFALSEVHRALKAGGRFTVWVPDALKIIAMAEHETEKFVELEDKWKCGKSTFADYLNPERDPWVYMNARVFWGARPGELGNHQHFHKAMFSFKHLKCLLSASGFSAVAELQRDSSVDAGHGWMEVGAEAIK